MGSAASWLHTRVHFAIGWKGDPRPRKAGSKLLLWQAATIALVESPNKFLRFPCGVTIWFAEDRHRSDCDVETGGWLLLYPRPS